MREARSARVRAGTPVHEALQGAITAISAAGCETPRLDAELLLAHVLAVPRERLLIDHDLLVAGPSVRAYQDAVRRRSVQREPLAYIVGHRDFRRLQLLVDPRALVPRPESELLVEQALGLPEGASVLDLGTGSGAVALALKDERPDLDVAGSDLSADALELARANGARLGLSVRWLHADLLDRLPDQFDALLANLPYVADSERSALAPEIVRHEPPGALFAGPDGLSAIRALLAQLARASPHRREAKHQHEHEHEHARVRRIALEVGAGQAPAVAELTRAAGFRTVSTERDLAGIERVVVGER